MVPPFSKEGLQGGFDASAKDLLSEAAQWHLLSLLLSRPTADRKREVSRLSDEIALPRLHDAARAWEAKAEEGAYLQLLGPGGIVAAREVAYRPFADPGWMLADIARYHEAFGFHPTAEEPVDHIAVLADFVAYLHLKEAYARECGEDPEVAITRGARKRFVEEHLVPVAARLAERLDACGAGAWSAAAHLIAEQIPAPPPAVLVSNDDDELSPCGSCAVS
jgi:nitrate reductase assembly molybdenum cofactor insertion protein NarJ